MIEAYRRYLQETNCPSAAATLVLAEVIDARQPEWLNVKQAAKRLGVSAGTIYQLCDAGQLPHVRAGKLIKIAPDDLGKIAREQPKPGKPDSVGTLLKRIASV
jgi:excisionase family DNA binding protein